jgi:invasion protein IalB
MDAKLEIPNGAGSNVDWKKSTNGKTAFLWDYQGKCWYELAIDKNVTWLLHKGELPTYIRMLLLTGGL